MVQEAASKKSNNLLLDTSDLAISQYSLLGQTVFDSPTMDTRDSISSELGGDQKQTPMEGGVESAVVCSQSGADLEVNTKSESSTCPLPEQSAVQSPLIVVTQQWDDGGSEDVSGKIESETIPAIDETSTCDGPVTCDTQDPPADLGSNISESAYTSALDSPQPTDVQAGSSQSELPEMPEDPATPELLNSDQVSEEASAIQPPSPSHTSGTDSPTKVSLGSLSEAIAPSSIESEIQQVQQTTDRAVYLTGQIKDNWELEKEKEEKQKGEEEKEVNETVIERKEVEMEGQVEHVDLTGDEPAALTAELTMASNTEQKKIEEIQYEVTESEVKTDKENTAEDEVHVEEEEVKEEKEASQSVQPEEPQSESPEELPLDSVAIIRELVTEVTEVETIITPTVPAGEDSDVTTSIPASDSDQL